MALPTQKRTKSSKKKRGLNFRLKKINYNQCPKCNRPVLPHHVCQFCGAYAGKEILKLKFKKGKKDKKEEKGKKPQGKEKQEKEKNQ